MKRTLMVHQRTALSRFSGSNVLVLFWQMRLGKTLTAIRWLQHKRPTSVLIVAPLSVLETWESELDLEGQPYVVLSGPPNLRLETVLANQSRWFLTNYEGLIARRKKGQSGFQARSTPLVEYPWDAVVLDESSRIRNPKAITTQVVRSYLGTTRYRAILTGLPNPEHPLDYFCQMAFATGTFLGTDSYWSFRQRYFHLSYNGFDWSPNRGTFDLMKQEIEEKASTLSLKDVDLGTTKISHQRFVDLPPRIRKHYNRCEEEYALGDLETKYAIVKRTWLHRVSGGVFPGNPDLSSTHKMDELLDLLVKDLAEEQVVVFFRFNAELYQASVELKKAGISCTRIHGGLSRTLRALRRRSASQGKFRVVLCQTRCVQYGLDFSFCSTAIYYSNWDEMEIRKQSEARIVHPMKKTPVFYVDLVCRDTVDVDVLEALKSKAVTVAQFKSKLVSSMRKRIG